MVLPRYLYLSTCSISLWLKSTQNDGCLPKHIIFDLATFTVIWLLAQNVYGPFNCLCKPRVVSENRIRSSAHKKCTNKVLDIYIYIIYISPHQHKINIEIIGSKLFGYAILSNAARFYVITTQSIQYIIYNLFGLRPMAECYNSRQTVHSTEFSARFANWWVEQFRCDYQPVSCWLCLYMESICVVVQNASDYMEICHTSA